MTPEETAEEQSKKMDRLIARAWADDAFKRKLMSNPEETLKAEGVEIPGGKKVKVVENTEKLVHIIPKVGREVRLLENTDEVVHFVLPVKPPEGELSDEVLDQVAGGKRQWSSRGQERNCGGFSCKESGCGGCRG